MAERVTTGLMLTRSLYLRRLVVPCGHCRAHSLRGDFPGHSHFLCSLPGRRGWDLPKQRWKNVGRESGPWWSSPLMTGSKSFLPTSSPPVPCLTNPHPCRRMPDGGGRRTRRPRRPLPHIDYKPGSATWFPPRLLLLTFERYCWGRGRLLSPHPYPIPKSLVQVLTIF